MKKRNLPLYFYRYILKDKSAFFVDETYNCLFQYDWVTEDVSFIHSFYGLLENEGVTLFQVEEIMQYENTMFVFISWYGFIICYDILANREMVIRIPYVNGKEFKICRVTIYEDCAWIFSFDLSQGIYVLDMKEMRLEKDLMLSDCAQRFSGHVCQGVVAKKEKQFLTGLYGTNIALEIDVVGKEITDFIVPVADLHLENIVCYDDVFYMVQTDLLNVYEWDRKTRSVIQYVNTQPEWIGARKISPYHDIVHGGDCIYIIPYFCNEIMKLDRKGGCVSTVLELPNLDHGRSQKLGLFYGHRIIEKKICFSPYGISGFLLYDLQKETIQSKKVEIDSEQFPVYNQLLEKIFKYRIAENEQILMCDLLNLILKMDVVNNVNAELKVGQKIFGNCSKDIIV